MQRVSSIECTACQDCVVACPAAPCLAVRPPLTRRIVLRPVIASVLAVALYLAVVSGFSMAGHWQTSISEAEYHRRLQQIDCPVREVL